MKKILSYIMVALFTIGTAMNVSAAEPEQRLSEYNAKSVVIIDTNLKTGEVTSYQTHAKQTYNRLKTPSHSPEWFRRQYRSSPMPYAAASGNVRCPSPAVCCQYRSPMQ